MSEIVHCPKCDTAVSVGSDQAGLRVQCPSCLKEFLAPSTIGGSADSSGDDDDWLILEDVPATKPTVGDSPFIEAAMADIQSADDWGSPGTSDDLLEEDPFVDVPEDPSDPNDLFADLPPIDGAAPATGNAASFGTAAALGATAAAGGQRPPASQAAQSIGADESFRVTCPVCGSMLYAKAKQTGAIIKCSDCFSEVRVPKPPKKKTQVKMDENAETFNLADAGSEDRRNDPYQKSAADLLRDAEADDSEKHVSTPYDGDIPSTVGWIKSIFGIFLDPGVVIHFVGLSILLGVPAAVTFAYPPLAIGAVPLALLGVTLSVACGFAILFGVANEHERIEDWPTVDPTGWIDSLWLVVVATAIAVGPAYAVATLFGAPAVLTIGLVMFCVYVAFPVILLSMLDEQSVTTPFSVDVGKSITRCQEEWGAFYFTSGAMFAALFAYFLMSYYTPTSVGIGVVFSVAVVFLYFAMIGRLALGIGKVVDLTALGDGDDDEQDA